MSYNTAWRRGVLSWWMSKVAAFILLRSSRSQLSTVSSWLLEFALSSAGHRCGPPSLISGKRRDRLIEWQVVVLDWNLAFCEEQLNWSWRAIHMSSQHDGPTDWLFRGMYPVNLDLESLELPSCWLFFESQGFRVEDGSCATPGLQCGRRQRSISATGVRIAGRVMDAPALVSYTNTSNQISVL